MSVYEGFKLILNCDFVAVADRKFCQIFYGKERMLQEEIAAYSFYDDESFASALDLARHFSRRPYFEKMWSAKKFEDQPGGYICMKRLEGPAFLKVLQDQDRKEQVALCLLMAKAIAELHHHNVAHGALDSENVLFDHHYRIPIILETITVSFKDQLDSENLAPEQRESEALEIATDIFWFGNVYLRQIKRPSRSLQKMIARCTHPNATKRPDIDTLLVELERMAQSELKQGQRHFFRPKTLLKAVGVAALLGSGIIGYRSWQSNLSYKHQQADAYQFLNSALTHVDQLPSIHEKVRYLRSNIPLATSEVQKSILLNNIREHLVETEYPVIDNLNEIVQAVFSLPNPMMVTQQGTLGMGSIVEAQNEQGFLYDFQKRRIFLQTAQGSTYLNFDHPYLLSTKARDLSNIFIPGGKENMRALLATIAQFYGFTLIDEGGRDGIISGYFSSDNIEAFLQQCTGPLGITFENGVITIKEVNDLRIYAPIRELPLGQYPNFESLMTFLAKPTGYSLILEDLGSLQTLDIGDMYVHNLPWKQLLTELGANYRLESRNGSTALVISQGDHLR